MKKFALLFITLVAVSCSEDEPVNTTDPIIGGWDLNDDFFDNTFIFNEDGTGTDTYSYVECTYSESGDYVETEAFETENFIWENPTSNPDFDSVSQSYTRFFFSIISPEEISSSVAVKVTFSSDFNSMTWDYGDGFSQTLTRN